MTGSQDFPPAGPPMAVSQHSPASTSSVSSSGSYGGYSGPTTRHSNPPPPQGRPTFLTSTTSYPASYPPAEGPADLAAHRPASLNCSYPPLINCDSGKGQHMSAAGEQLPGHFMPWESSDGTTHYTSPAGYPYDTAVPVVVTPPNGINNCEPNQVVSVTMCNNPPQQGEIRGNQHTVHFHVHQGEAVSLQLGEQVQMIQGPATVRMVSTNHEPPVPLPVQVPPGHYVHQVVDESGVLHHVILSQHPGVGGYGPAPPPANGTSQSSWTSQPSYVDPSAPPPNMNAAYPPSQPPPAYWNGRNEVEPKPSKSKNNRAREYDRRNKTKPGSTSPSLSVQSTPPQSPVKPRSNTYNRRGSNGSWRGSQAAVEADSEESGIGIDEDQEDREKKQLLLEILSNIRTPTVTEIRARAVLLVWSPPVSESGDPRFDKVDPIPDQDLEYEVLMSDKGKEGKYRSIFSGTSMECYLTDLRPHTEYHIRVHAILKPRNMKGGASDTVSFQTNACEPDQPAMPKLANKTKTSIAMRWNPPTDNGAHISHYILESDDASSISGQPGQFTTVYEGRAKTHNVPKLQPSTPYKFRLIAVNELGKSRPSELACFSTNGCAPSQPQPPSLAETSQSSLRVLWCKRPCDDEFTLQMDDQEMGHGFLPQYNGPEVEHVVTGLRRNTCYRFKLRAHNEMGASQYSPDVSFTTKPGRPGPPPKPQTKGRIRPHSFRVLWHVPPDNGGSQVTAFHLEMDDGTGWNSVYSGADLEFLCSDLQPGLQYRVRVAAESVGGVSDYSETCFVTTEPVVPGAPSSPILKDKPKAMSVHLVWQLPENDGGAKVTEYDVEMTTTDNVTRGVYRGRDTECVVASLAPGRIYLFQVRGHNRAGVGAWSMALEVLSGAGPPSRPKEPRATARSGTNASVAWDPPINNGAQITSYRLELATPTESPNLMDSESEDEEDEEEEAVKVEDEDDRSDAESHYDDESDASEVDQEREQEPAAICDTGEDAVEDSSIEEAAPEPPELEWRVAYQGPALSTDLKTLRPATQYQLRLSAVNSAGCSDTSCNVSMETPASTPATPHSLVAGAATASSLTVKWRRPAEHGEPLKHYNVEWGTNEKELTGQLVSERRRVHLTSLRADTTYCIRVQAVNAMGKGPFTPVMRLATRPLPPAPPKLECANISHNQMKLRWAEAKVHLGTTYVLEMENARKLWYQVYSGNNHSYKAAKLVENTEYRFRISAITEAGQGPFSTVHTFRTLYTPPPAVKGAPRVSTITESGCLVQWAGLKAMAAGEQLQYRIQLTRVKDNDVTLYQAPHNTEFRITGLEAKSDYTVRVAAERRPARDGPDSVAMVGGYSPTTQLATLARVGPPVPTAVGRSSNSAEPQHQAARSSWSDQKWAVIILCGFTLFAVFIAMVIQQLISWGTVSS